MARGGSDGARWLLLIHQIPPKPAYLRVKTARRLLQTGAVAIKNTVYTLPRTDATREDFQWLSQEIVRGGGEAVVCEARFVQGMRDKDLEDLFNRARNADYRTLADEARKSRDPARLRKRLDEIVAIDFFSAPGRAAAERALAGRKQAREPVLMKGPIRPQDLRRRTWVTREGVGIDRMGSAWLIRRFIDRAARFKFVPAKGYQPRPREIRFDMFEAEFTHEGDRCTFEVLIDRLGLDDPGLRPIAEIVHDVDLKDDKFGRDETRGLEVLISAIRERHASDEQRLARSSGVFDDLYEYFRRKRT